MTLDLARTIVGSELSERSLRGFVLGLPGVDAVGLEQRAAALATTPISPASSS